MVGEKLFFDELFVDVILVVIKWWVVVVVHALVGIEVWTFKDAGSGNAFSADAMAEVYVDGRVAIGDRNITQVLEGSECCIPIAVGGRVLTSKPVNKIAVVEIESDQSEAKKLGAMVK
jgi:hypothetical protein